MTPSIRARVARVIEQGIRCGILVVGLVGIRRRNPGAVVNAVVAFAMTFVPDIVERRHGVELRPWHRVYTAIAMLTHAVGMLGPYDDIWWWDHLTHVHSASLLGGVVHVACRRKEQDPRPRVLGVVVGVGLLWEVLEYGIHSVARRFDREPLLVSYGPLDTAFDLVFDALGALLVVVLGDRLLDEFDRTE
ncbi:hypothetical protein [Halorarius litoreus]|uniref:hypothetical protein n=1 Tax=Halorarius litoreus TaxID=2962676 RepID=UPI0020CD9AB0|nr:hypothetical protein [Halorarius litoreus]